MLKRCIAICMVLICLFCLASPAFAVDDFTLTQDLLNGLFWSMSRSVGISGENLNTESSDTTISSVGLTDVVSDYTSWFGLEEVEAIWDDIKNDITDLGTVKYSSGREVPSMKLRVTEDNVNSIKQFGYSVQEYWKQKNNLNNISNVDWITINELYGGYLTFGEQLIGIGMRKGSTNIKFGSYGTYVNEGLFCIGMDLYQHSNTEGSFYHNIHFDPEHNQAILLKNLNGTNKSILNQAIYLYYVQPITISSSSSISFGLPYNGLQNNTSGYCYWYKSCIMNDEQYQSWLVQANQFNQTSIRSVSAGSNVTDTILGAGTYYLVSTMDVKLYNVNTPTNITNEIVLRINNNSYYARNRLFGVNRVETWSLDVTDSGTGTPITLNDALYTYFPSIFDEDIDEPYIYFPSNITYIPELTDVLTKDYPVTGSMTVTINPNWPEGVQTEITPPSSTGLPSIWYYVSDTYAYCATFFSNIWQVISVSFASTPIYKFAFVPIVLAIIFGMYRRFIE